MMKDSGMALMGCGSGSGKDRIQTAVKQAFESPLLNDFDLKTAKNVLVNITAGRNEQGITMRHINEINSMIEEYTGGANNFKKGLIWDDDPAIGDTIHITSIVTGLRFTDVLGATKDMGNFIFITDRYVYDKNERARGEGIPLFENSSSSISYNSSSNVRTFHYDPAERPVLCVRPGEDKSELTNIPANRRKHKND